MHVHTMSPAAPATSQQDGSGAIAVGELLSITGSDALPFVQAQVMSDAAALADGGWQWSGWLTPKGRLVAFFALVRVSASHWLAWLPAGGAEALRDRLQRFVFRSKVAVAAATGTPALGIWGDAVPQAGVDAASACLQLPDPGPGPSRRLWLFADPVDARPCPSHADDALERRWRLADLQLGLPYVAAGAANSEQFVPAWLSLQRLDAFSVRKGCYPGQEIVARMHFLGQGKRSALRIHGPGDPPPAMSRVLDGNGDGLGDVVWSVAAGDGRWQALAVVTEGRQAQVAAVAGVGPAEAAG
jgi:folate-binding protein YgfZ